MLTPLYSRLGNDPDLSDLVEMFVEGMADRIARLEDACARRDWTNLRKTAHQLKGSAGGYGFDTIT
ncbi:MAG: Hpt domain-containing protein, partial [Pirellulaceae bacterium]